MFAEEGQRARPGEVGARLVVARALVAVEAMIGRMDMDLDLRVSGADLADAGDRIC